MSVLALSLLLLCIIFLIGWLASIKIKNASIVDAMWVLCLIIPVSIYLLQHEGSLIRDAILICMAFTWSLRLGLHLAWRIYRQHPEEDARYAGLRLRWGQEANRNFAVLFLINALLVFLLSIPFYFGSKASEDIQIIELIGLAIFAIGFLGEMLSDAQLSYFKRTNRHSRGICNIGLWKYSRHPNYFFEAVIWVGIYVFCAVSPNGVFAIHAPLIMIFLLTKVTGIPPIERVLLKSKGKAYSDYQQTTSSFIPWFNKQKL